MTLKEYLASLQGKRVSVVGAGLSNRPLVGLLADSGVDTTVYDKSDAAGLGAFYEDMPPGAAQASSTFMPGRSSAHSATAWAAGSCT